MTLEETETWLAETKQSRPYAGTTTFQQHTSARLRYHMPEALNALRSSVDRLGPASLAGARPGRSRPASWTFDTRRARRARRHARRGSTDHRSHARFGRNGWYILAAGRTLEKRSRARRQPNERVAGGLAVVIGLRLHDHSRGALVLDGAADQVAGHVEHRASVEVGWQRLQYSAGAGRSGPGEQQGDE